MFQLTKSRRIIACRGEQKLEIGAGEFCSRSTEHLRARDPERQRASAGRDEAHCLTGQTNPVRQLIDVGRVLRPMRNARDVVVLQIAADTRKIVQDGHADGL